MKPSVFAFWRFGWESTEPILHFKPGNTIKMLHITRDQDQVHGLVKIGRWRPKVQAPCGFIGFQDSEKGMIVRDALGAVIIPFGIPLEMRSRRLGQARAMPRQRLANGLLFSHRQAFDQFDDMQRSRAHAPDCTASNRFQQVCRGTGVPLHKAMATPPNSNSRKAVVLNQVLSASEP